MEPRSNAVETPPPPALPNDEARVRFVLKRPDGAKRISTTAPLPVKYAMEDEIVDEALQRGGLRKNKASIDVLLACILTISPLSAKAFSIPKSL